MTVVLHRLYKAFLAMAWLLPFYASAQFSNFRNYNVKDGLPSSEVYVCMQDSEGYMWFSTDMGVSRFNGYEFKNYSTENGLADNNIYGIYQDGKQRIWFRSLSSRLSYFLAGTMHTLPCNVLLDSLYRNIPCTSVYVDKGDTIWMGSTNAMVVKIAPGWQKKNVQVIRINKHEKYICLVDDHGFVFGGTSTNYLVHTYDRQGKKRYSSALFAGSGPIKSLRYYVTRLADGTLLASINNLLACMDGPKILSRTALHSTIICLFEDKDKKIYTGTYEGALVFDDHRFGNRQTIEKMRNKVVPYICRDHEDGLWYCTEGQGIYYLPFRNILYYTPDDGLCENKLSCIEKCGDKIMVGHLDETVTILDKQQITSMHYDNSQGNVITSNSNRTTAMTFDETRQRLYIGMQDKVYTMDLPSLKIRNTLLKRGAKKLMICKNGHIRLLGFEGLIELDPDRAFREVKNVPLHFFSDNAFEDSKGNLYVSSLRGLWCYRDTTGADSTSLRFMGSSDSLLRSRVVQIREAPNGSLWMATRGNGVIVKKGDQLFHILQKNGLSGNMCRAIYMDPKQRVWVGTNNGLSKITLQKGEGFVYRIVNYNSTNGLLTNEVNSILPDGDKLLLAHNNGISVLDPESIANNTSPPPVYIVKTLVEGVEYPPGLTNRLAYNQNYMSFYYIGLSYKDAGNLEYKYKMEGIDSSWVYTHYTSVKYQTIPPGTYRFVVYARNNDGYWSKEPAAVAFTVLPAWWQTWWLKLLCGLALLALLCLAFMWRLNTVKRRERERSALQNRIKDTELKALRAQMNPHFIFNAMNSVQYFITRHDPASSQKYLSKFARLIRYVVDNSKLEAIPLEKELEALHLYLDLESLRFETHFEYEISIDRNVDVSETRIPSMLIQPYIENAIWHGLMHKQGNGKISLHMKMDGEILRCTVEDNGIGRKRSAELRQQQGISTHHSQGMSITRERLEMINQINRASLTIVITDLEDEAGNALGTRVELTIPAY